MTVGESQKRVTLREAIKYEPVCMKLAVQISILKNCRANAGSNA